MGQEVVVAPLVHLIERRILRDHDVFDGPVFDADVAQIPRETLSGFRIGKGVRIEPAEVRDRAALNVVRVPLAPAAAG